MNQSYDFCNYLDHYITRERWMSSESKSLQYTYYCRFSFVGYNKADDLEKLCANFKNLYSKIFSSFSYDYSRNKENIEYINYWLIKELKNKKILDTSAKEFYQKLISEDSEFDTQRKLKDKIHDIEVEHLKKLNILYDLYTIYYDIKNTSYNNVEMCNSHSTKCFQKFTEAIQSCSTDKKDKYCEALKSFKNIYEQLNENNKFQWCNKVYILPLPPLGEENVHKASVMEPGADTSELEPPQEEKRDQDLGAGNNLEEERKALKPSILPSFSPPEEKHYDNNISTFTIFGIILSISVFSTITYK
ncbi:PIR protein, partial [Plasmodium vivax]